MSYRIIVDLSHNEQVEEFPEFSLGEDDYQIDYIESGPIEFEDLEDYDILFIGNVDHSKIGKSKFIFTPDELKNIKRFVGEGGGLILTTGAGGDQDVPMKKGSIRVFYKMTGVKRFWNGIVQGSKDNFLVKKKNLVVTDIFSHPITKGVTELVFPNSTFFTLSDEEVDDIVVSSEKTDFKYNVDEEIGEIGQVPLVVVSQFYSGRCVTIGSSDFLLEDAGDYGIDAGDNLLFLERVIKWLMFEI